MSEEEIIEKYHHFKIKTADGTELDLIETKYYKELLDLYNKEKEKNKKIEDKIKEKIEWLEKNILENDYANENDKDVAENQIYILEWLI